MKNLKILIVEDDGISKDIICNALEKEYTIKTANDGYIGLELYKSFSPNIVITDLNMPRVNGIEMLKKIREKDKTTKVIILTAHKDIDYLMEATELNLTKYLVKPVVKSELLEAIDIAIKDINSFEYVSKKLFIFEKEFYWDFDKKILIYNNEEIKLTPKQREVLEYLIKNVNIVNSYDDILYSVWNSDEFSDKNSLKTLVSGLKKKLPKDIIENVYGEGYKISRS